MGDKTITIKMDDDIYKKVKLYCVANDKSIKDFVAAAVLKEMANAKKK